ncbi:replication protein A 70 kDa DNA-binding subunit B isoform X1 [Quercus suber]|uniref:replication protein A 70 kDa DNA-binding subunit B isoform X1 n=2 Tax=Quercus suber TaxID=58331 RepID=UPI000CE17371|nr:replication protein A 70 kDa DNA-binding subunit B-like isoform X1 [Quercus suber]
MEMCNNQLMQRSNFWINETISITKLDQQFWYMACSKCHQATGVDYNEEFSCLYCKEKAVANPRCRLEVKLDDATGHLMATLFGDEAEKFLSCSAIKLMNETIEDGIKNIESFVKLSADKNFLIQVRAIKLDTPTEPML